MERSLAKTGAASADDARAPRPLGRDAPVLVPVFVMSPIAERTGHWRIMEIERFALPSHVASPGRFVVRMEDDALEPQVRRGAYLVVDMGRDRLPELAADAALFAVSLRGEGLVARLAHWDATRQQVAQRLQLRRHRASADARVLQETLRQLSQQPRL